MHTTPHSWSAADHITASSLPPHTGRHSSISLAPLTCNPSLLALSSSALWRGRLPILPSLHPCLSLPPHPLPVSPHCRAWSKLCSLPGGCATAGAQGPAHLLHCCRTLKHLASSPAFTSCSVTVGCLLVLCMLPTLLHPFLLLCLRERLPI